jgi:hypothetical protein
MGDDDPRLRWHWLHGISPEVKASIDGGVIHDHQVAARHGDQAKMKIEMPSWLSVQKLGEPPSAWLPIFIAVAALAVSITSATFTGFNYFRSPPKARAAIVVDHFEDGNIGSMNVGSGEKTFHQLRMWITNTGQSLAAVQNVAISPELSQILMTAETESQRMAEVAKNKATIGVAQRGSELATNQKLGFPTTTIFPEELWSEFTTKKQFLYVFAVISFSDELSGNQEATTEICARFEANNLGTWRSCASGHNATIRP